MNFTRKTNEVFGARNAGYTYDETAERQLDKELLNRIRADRGERFVDDIIDAFEDFDGDLYLGDDGEHYQVGFVYEDGEEKPFAWRRLIRACE